ncbi:hypothetical protein SNE26_28930 [Mucilaginibacter sp. cycad4]|uniref:hypothetical protein n=1 Tax=Mucilaginibacter sp. cycad4 TaxID=3342096 RepID=UPI002AAB695C|nr:hypothetical protein [Mucilaginibacter gossypii]WPV00040.1 hypothetical protein SNE26_28930 [Mucilaginibacter gossypii]
MKESLTKLEDFFNHHSVIVLGIIAVLTLICSIVYNLIFKKTYKISKSDYDKKLSNFSVYLINAFRLTIKKSSKKYLFFNITISNKATAKYTYVSTLEIEYIRDDNSKESIILDYVSADLESPLVQKLTFFSNEIRLDEKDSESKWLLYEFPNILKSYRISKYVIKIRDIDGNVETVDVFLIKDIKDEN